MSRSSTDRSCARSAAHTLAAFGLALCLSIATERTTEAGIVHTTVNETVTAFSPSTSYDLNAAGIHFLFSGSSNVVINSGPLTISTGPGVPTSPQSGIYASGSSVIGLAADTVIDATLSPGTFASGTLTIGTAQYGGISSSGLVGLGDTFLGFRFSLVDGTHYGWIQVKNTITVNGDGEITQLSLLIKDFAYETTAGASIKAGQTYSPPPPTVPEPASLVQLAMGAGGLGALAALRRRRHSVIDAA